MAREQRLNVDITASDRASAKITDVATKVERLDGKQVDVRIDGDTSGIDGAISGLEDSLGGLAGNLGQMAGPAGVGALVGGLVAAADAAADTAINADNLASLTGDSVEYASKLNALWGQTGADTKDLQDVLLQMNGVLGTNADLAKQLGVNLTDGATIGQRFEEVSAALDKIPDAAERSRIASQVFGEEGVRQYNALRNSVDDLSTAIDEVPEGMVITAADVEEARRYKAALNQLKTEFQGIATEVGGSLLPALADVLTKLNDIGNWEPPGSGGRGASLFDGIKSAAAGLVEGKNPIQTFVEQGMEDAQAVVDAKADAIAAGVSGPLLDAWSDVQAAAVEALAAPPNAGDAASQIADEIDNARDQFERFGDDGVENMNDVEDATEDAKGEVEELTESFSDLRAEIANRGAYRDLEQSFDDVHSAAVEAYTAGAEGSADAEQAARDHAQSLDDLRDQVYEYGASLEGLPPQRVTEIIAAVDRGDLAEAERLLALLERDRVIQVRINTGQINPNLRITPGERSADGNYNHPAGLGVVNDGVGPEIIELPGGSKVMTGPNSANYMRQQQAPAPVQIINKTVNQYVNIYGQVDAGAVTSDLRRRMRGAL